MFFLKTDFWTGCKAVWPFHLLEKIWGIWQKLQPTSESGGVTQHPKETAATCFQGRVDQLTDGQVLMLTSVEGICLVHVQ